MLSECICQHCCGIAQFSWVECLELSWKCWSKCLDHLSAFFLFLFLFFFISNFPLCQIWLFNCCSIYLVLTLSNSLQISLIFHLGLNCIITFQYKSRSSLNLKEFIVLVYSFLHAFEEFEKSWASQLWIHFNVMKFQRNDCLRDCHNTVCSAYIIETPQTGQADISLCAYLFHLLDFMAGYPEMQRKF